MKEVFEYLLKEYTNSEVVSGEFIHSAVIPKNLGITAVYKEDVVFGVQSFLNWDESEETFEVVERDNGWVIKYPENAWLKQLKPIITEFKDGADDTLCGDEVDSLVHILKAKINLNEGNITEDEYNKILG